MRLIECILCCVQRMGVRYVMSTGLDRHVASELHTLGHTVLGINTNVGFFSQLVFIASQNNARNQGAGASKGAESCCEHAARAQNSSTAD